MGRLRWRGIQSGPPPGGKTPEDMVQNAIMKTMAESRTWDRELTPFQHLAGAISSEISALVNSAENQRTLLADEDKVINIADHLDDPETSAIRKSQEQRFFAHLEAKRLALRQLAEMMLYRPASGPMELAAQLNLSIRELDSLKRALKRATEEFLKGEGAIHQTEHQAVKQVGE
jgi:hypothetical protein